jgi:hypothetical protein
MRIKSIIPLLVCFLLFSPTVSLIAHECNPPCEGCESCEGGVCVDDNTNCGGECGSCVGGLCNGCDPDNCEECNLGFCVSSCSWVDCEECDGNGSCVSQCTSCEECSAGVCVECCVNCGSACSWSEPGIESGCPPTSTTDLTCPPGVEDKICDWILTDTIKDWSDTCPCCTLLETPCVELTPSRCRDVFIWTIGVKCACDQANPGPPVAVGSGDECPP